MTVESVKEEILINVTPSEVRAALLENGVVQEVHIERATQRGVISNIYKGRNRDTAWFAAIDSEWPQLKRRFERYLDTGNLDAENRPKTSLTSLTKPLLYKHDTFEFCE